MEWLCHCTNVTVTISSPSNKNHDKHINNKIDNTAVMSLILLSVLIHMWAFMLNASKLLKQYTLTLKWDAANSICAARARIQVY